MTIYYVLIILFYISVAIHFAFICKKYIPYISGYINGKSIWNTSYDRLRLLAVVTIFIAPILLFRGLRQLEIKSDVITYIALALITTINVLFIYFSQKIIWSKQLEKPNEKIYEFKNFFINKSKYNQTIELLVEHNFFSKSKTSEVKELMILVCKLNNLGLLKNIHRKQNKLCSALSNFFNIPKFSESNLSRALNDFKDNSFTQIQEEVFESFSYLDRLK